MGNRIASAKTCGLVVVLVVLSACRRAPRQEPPNATNPSQLRPSELLAQTPAKPAPSLTGSGDPRRAVRDFLAWAGASTPAQEEEGRRAIAAAGGDAKVVQALSDEITAARGHDDSRALLGLSVLGEMRSPHALAYLRDFIHLPLPPLSKQLIEGEDPAQSALATLQAKAVGGLAYMNTPESNQEVFWAVGKHESRIVRAEAIRTYLMNHENSAEARATLRRYIRKGEEIFLDRPNRDPGDSAAGFNRKLAAYLRAHPELAAPRPDTSSRRGEPGRTYDYKQPVPGF